MTNYGDVFEVWLMVPTEEPVTTEEPTKSAVLTEKLITTGKIPGKLCATFTYGLYVQRCRPRCTLIGNEEGWAPETNWSPLRRDEFYPGSPNYLELRSGHEDGDYWVPAEVNVSIRPGWYYHPYEDHKVKTLPQLLDIYYNSIGRNGSLLINFPG